MLLKDKVVVVTGSCTDRGIGKGIATWVAKEGGKVVASDFKADLVESFGKELKEKGYDGMAVLCDVTKKKDVDNLLKTAFDKYGKIDAAVSVAGMTDICKFEDMDEESWDKVISINLKGTYLLDYAVVPYLKKNGKGKIINIGSDCALEGWEYLSAYSASKFGVRGLTQALAKELGKFQINVNCICPGIIDTGMWKRTDELFAKVTGVAVGETWKNTVARIPWGRGGTNDDLGKAAVMLLSEYADYITGASLPVGGGSAVN